MIISNTFCFRYMSRFALVQFPPPCLDIAMTNYVHVTDLIKRCASAIGSIIGLVKNFIDRGIGELDSYILPKLRSMLTSSVVQVLPCYAILMWFTLEVNI